MPGFVYTRISNKFGSIRRNWITIQYLQQVNTGK